MGTILHTFGKKTRNIHTYSNNIKTDSVSIINRLNLHIFTESVIEGNHFHLHSLRKTN